MIWTLLSKYQKQCSSVDHYILAIAVGLATDISGTLRVGQYDTLVHSGVSQLAGHVVYNNLAFKKIENPLYSRNGNIFKTYDGKFPDST